MPRNLAGRAYLDDGKPATAAMLLLSNRNLDRDGERAPDSVYYLGEALLQLNKRSEACAAFAELQKLYGAKLRPVLRQRLSASQAKARCLRMAV